MIRIWHSLHQPLKTSIQTNLKYYIGGKPINFKKLSSFSTHCKTYSVTTSVNRSAQVNMNTFKFSDYDCIGFDLDNTLLRYSVSNMVRLVYEILADYLVKKKGYSSKYLLKPLEDKDLDFMQKGLFLDFERGNILRISADGKIQRVCHGTDLLSIEKIQEIYPEQRWDAIDVFCNDMFSTWNGPISTKMRPLLDYFDISTSLIFARLIDTLDEEHRVPLNVYNVWPDMLDGLIEMYNKDQFKLDRGYFFPSLKRDPEKFIRKCDTKIISWLKELKKHRTTFLITGSNADFVDFTATYAFGKDWRSLFDIVVCYAKKPGFFINERPFFQVINYDEGDITESENLERGGIYSQGNWKGLLKFLGRMSEKTKPRCVYVGDNLLQDVYVPSAYTECDAVAVIEEQMSEGMVYQGLSHPDEKILNSTLWGSYFCLKDATINTDSLWGYIIKKYAKFCIPEVELIAQQPIEESYMCFSKDGKKYDGYYPAVPLSISTF